ncbi:LOW QUALITY PROTEIN: hypothetical protein QTO34_017024 [Cnephaeus nilssonii]|uniref:RNase H type-1 domain-containing protein n=1 Tax=Cnephaeus nilssonii TaxID=3371016 RepID=A0AA40LR37_CNENI|nr:LOW QUALITY PROTEIN: hypothetical protein QTO34_017024 [Eptesicus nilssonii]
MAILVKKASKLAFGQDVQVVAPHAVETLLHSPPERWLSNACITQYQVLLLDPPRLLEDYSPKPSHSPPRPPDEEAETPLHDSEETLTSLRADLIDQPISNPEETLFTDGSSFVEDGIRYAGAAIVTQERIIWAQSLGYGTSAQKAELIALTQTLRWGKVKRIDIYTDSRYAFATVHIHGALYQERGLLTSGGKDIKNAPAILNLLSAIWGPKEVAVHPEEEDTARRCQICAQVNPGPPITGPPGTRFRGSSPGEHWEVDFTELPSGLGGYRYLLAGQRHTRLLPRFGLPLFMGSDNGPAFITKSSGQVERMNQTLKDTITKLKLETGENWVGLFPLSLLRARCTPYVKGLTPFEIMFGHPPPLLLWLKEEGIAVLSNRNLLKSLQALQSSTAAARRIVRAAHQEAHPPVPDSPPVCAPGHLVWVQRHEECRLWSSWSSTPIAGESPEKEGRNLNQRFDSP